MIFKYVRQPVAAFCIVAVGSILAACQNDSKPEQVTSASGPVTTPTLSAVDQATELLREFRPFMHGVWVSKRYERELERTRSAEKSWDALMGTPEIFLDMRKPLHDTIKVFASANNHEGDEFWLLLRRGLTPASLLVSRGEYDEETDKGNHWELAYRVHQRDTILYFRCVTPAGKIKEETAYQRFFRSFVNYYDVSAVSSLVRQKLYAGTYRVLFPANYDTPICFGIDGTLKGVDGKSYYDPQTDFMTPPGGENLCFEHSSKNGASVRLLPQRNGDTLSLYEAIEPLALLWQVVFRVSFWFFAG